MKKLSTKDRILSSVKKYGYFVGTSKSEISACEKLVASGEVCLVFKKAMRSEVPSSFAFGRKPFVKHKVSVEIKVAKCE